MEEGRDRSHIASAPCEDSSSDCRSRERDSIACRAEESTGKKSPGSGDAVSASASSERKTETECSRKKARRKESSARVIPEAYESLRSARIVRRTGFFSSAEATATDSHEKKGRTEGSSGRERRSAKHHSTASRSVWEEKGSPLPRSASKSKDVSESPEKLRRSRKTGAQELKEMPVRKAGKSSGSAMRRRHAEKEEARDEASALLSGFPEMDKTSREGTDSAAPHDRAVKITGRDRSAAWPTESRKDDKVITPKILQLRFRSPGDPGRS